MHAEWKEIWEDFPSVNTYNDLQKSNVWSDVLTAVD